MSRTQLVPRGPGGRFRSPTAAAPSLFGDRDPDAVPSQFHPYDHRQRGEHQVKDRKSCHAPIHPCRHCRRSPAKAVDDRTGDTSNRTETACESDAFQVLTTGERDPDFTNACNGKSLARSHLHPIRYLLEEPKSFDEFARVVPGPTQLTAGRRHNEGSLFGPNYRFNSDLKLSQAG
jgi:hypothetical protein